MHKRKINIWQGTEQERGKTKHLHLGTELLNQPLGRSHLFILRKSPLNREQQLTFSILEKKHELLEQVYRLRAGSDDMEKYIPQRHL